MRDLKLKNSEDNLHVISTRSKFCPGICLQGLSLNTKLRIAGVSTCIRNGRIEVRECLLSFGAESFVCQFAIQKFKD